MSGKMNPLSEDRKRRICYFFDSDIGNYHYGPGHPMKPHRIRMTHALVMNYGLYKKMEIFRAKPATRKEMAQFHTDDYVDFLSRVTPDNMDGFLKEQAKFNLGDDCPVFDGLFEYCSISAGGSMEGAARLSRDKCDIAVNWAGGFHHAKKAEANGFCYVNDIVLGILELLRYHKRVLYVDIDVHHGDGVEEAFYTTDRVMTCSFHKYGEFFPGTGELRDTGHGKGKHYAVNFPLRDGITDESYKNIFQPVIMKIMETYQPSAIVLQCGGDSLSGDRLGSFNVSMRGHASCVQFIRSLGLPLLLLGGGGYTIRNVSRTWAYETGLAAGQELCTEIPMNEYYEYFGPTYRLEVPASNMEDMNVPQYLEKVKIKIFENLRHTIHAPSVGLQPIPKLSHDDEMEVDEDFDDPNDRRPQRLLDALIQRDDEFSDSEDEGEGGRRDIQSHKRLRNRLHQSPQTNGRRPSLKPAVLKPPQRTTRRSGTTYDVTRSRQSSLSSSTTTSATPNLRSRLHDEASDSKLGEVGLSTHTSSPCATRWADKANPQMIHDSADAPLPNVNQVVTKLPDSRTISGSPLSRRSPSERRSPPPETLNSVLDPIVQSSTSTLTPSSQPNGILESVKKAVEEPIEMNESSLISDQSTSALELMPTDETAHPIINQVENESDVNVITNSLVQSMENSVDTQKVLSTEIEMEIEMDAPNVEANTQELDDTMEVDKVDASEEFIKQESGEAEQLTEQIAKFLPEKMDVDIVAIEQTPEEIALTSINLKDEEKFEKTEITLGLEEIGTRLDKSQAQLGVLASTSFPPVEGSTSSLPIEPSFKTDPLKDTEMVGMIKSLRSPRLEANETMSTGALETKISSQLHEPELDPKAELERMANQLVEEVERESLKAVIQPATKDEKGSDVENDAARENEKVKETDPQAKQNITLIEVEHDPRLPTLGSREEEQVLELSTKPVEDYKVTLLESLCAAVERKDKAFEDRSGVEQGGDMMVQRAVNPMMDPQLNHVPVTKQVSQPFVRPGGTHTQDLNSGVVESSSVTTTDSNSGSGSGKERAEIEERLGGELSVEKGFDERRRDEKEEDSESFKKSSMSSIDPLITSSSLT